ncbi:MAG: YlbG family protein [Apilactobacillus sp.]|uniref:YlbG family protein n=1 Tax=Apilactobacillus TaxID=2767877 RepID=UPI0025F36AFD|nr:YlbG family protein [Apilactobacillus sp.]MCT6822876.1 YlbG family protein [Apilactobacillus sp.]MCT6858905.1 YlbG family protein [Apilactobacillus sp.]
MSGAIEDRKSLIVYVYSTKQVRQLKKYGLIYYVSQKMHYVVMYVNADNYEWVKEKISSLRIVKKVEETPYEQIANELAVANDFDEVDDDEDY